MFTELGLLQATNNFATTLIAPIDGFQTAIAIASAGSLPQSGVVSIDSEIVAYSSINTSGTNPVLNGCIRGYDNTTAVIHAQGTTVEVRWVAVFHNGLVEAILTLQSALGSSPQQGYADLTTCLTAALPIAYTWSLNGPAASFTVTHSKGRIVGVQVYRWNGSTYELIEAPIQQTVGSVTVFMNLGSEDDESGYIILI
jgi:hypothetical protein